MHISAADSVADVLDRLRRPTPVIDENAAMVIGTTYEGTSTRSINGSDSTIGIFASDDGVSEGLTPRP